METIPSSTARVALSVTAIAGATALPLWQPGIGWLVTAAIAAGAVVAVRRARSAVDGGGAGTAGRLWRLGAAVAAIALVTVAGVRSAPWLVALCLGTGVALAGYALVGGRTWGDLLRGLFALPTAVPAGVAWAMRRDRPDADDSRPTQPVLLRALAGIVIGIALLLVFGLLFVQADSAFADLLASWWARLSVATIMRPVLGFGVALLLAAASLHLLRTPPAEEPAPVAPRRHSAVEWAIPLAMLDVLFGVFVFVQVTVLFAGRGHVLAPGGPDYAVYARGGFVQLMVVTTLTLVVAALLAAFAGRETKAQRWLLRGLGGALGLLTLVVVASALMRLGLYATAYGFSVPRLLGYAGEVWLGLVVALVVVAGLSLQARWLPRAVVASAVGVLLALAAINPEALMARTHIARLDHQFPLDIDFLGGLSADAIDELARLPGCYKGQLREDLAEPDPWYAWNLSRQHARAVLAASQDC